MVELEKSIQLEILKGAVKNLRTNKDECGCCSAIINAARDLKDISTCCSELNTLIPSFTRENAFRLAKQKKFKMPDNSRSFWWKHSLFMNVRIRFLNSLIAEMKAK